MSSRTHRRAGSTWPAAQPCALVTDQRGAVFVEQLIVFLPFMFFFLAVLQTIELCTANLVMKRAASAAARAAAVVLPDDRKNYAGTPEHEFSGPRAAAVAKAASMILKANSHFDQSSVRVSVTGARGVGPLTATVSARFQCFASFVNVVCGGGSSRELKGLSTQAYHGAEYAYE